MPQKKWIRKRLSIPGREEVSRESMLLALLWKRQSQQMGGQMLRTGPFDARGVGQRSLRNAVTMQGRPRRPWPRLRPSV